MINIAPQSYAFQSSCSRWSYDINEANNALNGYAPTGYSFHTSNNGCQWWTVDLKKIYPVNKLVMYKRRGFEDLFSAEELIIYISRDLSSWENRRHPDDDKHNNCFFIDLNNEHMRFLRICIWNKYLYFRQVEIWANDELIPFRNINLYKSDLIKPNILSTIMNQSYEAREINTVLNNISNDDTVLELGASIGAMSTIIKSHYPALKYYAVEANRDLIPLIKRNHDLNNVSCNIINAAVGNGNKAKFYVHEQCWMSSLMPFDNPKRIDSIDVIELTKLITDTCANFLIIDVEGAEYMIFDKYVDLSNISKICIEMHKSNDMQNLYDYFIEHGFKCDSPINHPCNQCVRYFYKPVSSAGSTPPPPTHTHTHTHTHTAQLS